MTKKDAFENARWVLRERDRAAHAIRVCSEAVREARTELLDVDQVTSALMAAHAQAERNVEQIRSAATRILEEVGGVILTDLIVQKAHHVFFR
jgi:hypothetical protein